MKDNSLLQFLEKKRNLSSKKELNPPKKKIEKKQLLSSQSNKFSKSIPTFLYSYNTYEGKVRNYNEDKIQIKIDLKIPNKDKNIIWPPIHYFAIFDGHGGNKCSDFLKENFHKLLIENKNFPRKPIKSLKQTFVNIEKLFFNKFKPKNLIDNIEYSGSCVIIILIIEYKVYCANLGDSRALYSQNSSKEIYQINKEHKPNSKSEKERIYKNGGKIYQNDNFLGLKNIPWRILPGRLAISRAIGDLYAKIPEFGGNPNVLIATPDIITFDLNDKSDGIFDCLSNRDICKIAWNCKFFIKDNCEFYIKEVCDHIMRESMEKGSVDNISCIFIGFNNYFSTLKDVCLKKKGSVDKIICYLDNLNCDRLIKSTNNYNKENNKLKKNNESFEYEIHYEINSNPNKVFYSEKKINPKNSSIENYYNQLNK